MILTIWKLTALFFCSILVHEAGHYLYFLIVLKRKVKITFDKDILVGEPKDYLDLTKAQLFWLYFSGVYLGLVFIIIVSQSYVYTHILIPFYLLGSKSDFKNMWNLRNQLSLLK